MAHQCQGGGVDLLPEHAHLRHHRHRLCPRVLPPGGRQLLPLPLQGLIIILLYQYLGFILQFHSWIKILGDGTIFVEKKAKKEEESAKGELRVKTPET